MGQIAAGVPIEAISHESDKVAVPGQMLLAKATTMRLRLRATR